MLCDRQSHANYQGYLLSALPGFLSIERNRVLKLEGSTSKLYLLNLDRVRPVIEKLYSNTGRLAKNQQGIIRSLVLMLDQKVDSILSGPLSWPLILSFTLCAALIRIILPLWLLIMILSTVYGALLLIGQKLVLKSLGLLSLSLV